MEEKLKRQLKLQNKSKLKNKGSDKTRKIKLFSKGRIPRKFIMESIDV